MAITEQEYKWSEKTKIFLSLKRESFIDAYKQTNTGIFTVALFVTEKIGNNKTAKIKCLHGAIKGMNQIYIPAWMDLKHKAELKSKYRVICQHLYNIFKHIKHNDIYHYDRYIGKDLGIKWK